MTHDECPFHHLDPASTVVIQLDGVALPSSAERACDEWHLAVAFAPIVSRAMAFIAERIDAEIEAAS